VSQNPVELGYLISAVLFILGLKGLTRPKTAVRGNLLGALGMFVAIVVTVLSRENLGLWPVGVGIVLGTVAGIVFATRVQMTGMPELVALFNGFGGLASTLVAGATLQLVADDGGTSELVAIAVSGLIGAVTFSGSLIAWGKLREIRALDRIEIPAHHVVNALFLLACLGLSWVVVSDPRYSTLAYWVVVTGALLLGVSLVVQIGGADMPVVIALLNSYSGLAAAATGFVLSNTVLIISGSLVGASGLILTRLMCVAMNRSLTNVLFGTMGGGGETPDADEVYLNVKTTSPEEVAMLLEVASRVVIVPGYGMAVAQAQHVVSDLRKHLVGQQIDVEFAIHPVAGRMPGHMNVLLAEADVPYEALVEMDEINPTMETSDVTIVLGANDVVNPLARTDPDSPIAGMPVIDVDKSRTVVVIKRSLSPGFAGIPNPLFAAENALMLYGDGRKAVQEIIAALNQN